LKDGKIIIKSFFPTVSKKKKKKKKKIKIPVPPFLSLLSQKKITKEESKKESKANKK